MSNDSIKETINQFTATWEAAVNLRVQACEIYAKAVNEGGTQVKDAFQRIPRFKNWTQNQWRFIYLVGSGAIDPVLVDFKNTSVPIALADHYVSPCAQRAIHRSGLQMYTVKGEQITVKLQQLKVGHICQVYKEDGTKRTKEEQKQYILDKQKDNIEIIKPGLLRVNHGCYIDKAAVLKIVNNPAFGLSISEIIEDRKARK